MSTFTKFWRRAFRFGVILLVTFAVVVIVVGLAFFDDEIARAILAASGTALISVLSALTVKFFEGQQEIEQGIRDKKIPVYEEFVVFVMRQVMPETPKSKTESVVQSQGKPPRKRSPRSGSDNKDESDREIRRFARSFTAKLILWGTDDVIKEWSTYRRQFVPEQDRVRGSAELDEALERTIFGAEELFKTIRKDLGHGDEKLERGDILGLFINDIDRYL